MLLLQTIRYSEDYITFVLSSVIGEALSPKSNKEQQSTSCVTEKNETKMSVCSTIVKFLPDAEVPFGSGDGCLSPVCSILLLTYIFQHLLLLILVS